MNEEFLHYIWKYHLFHSDKLHSGEGEEIEVIKTGEHNRDSGPDFSNARIRIGKTLWAGNVEVHVNASDWNKHHHKSDKAYDNIILHVVFTDDEKIYRSNNELVPSLSLRGLISKTLFNRHESLMNNRQWIPCENQLHNADTLTKEHWLERMLVERLESRAAGIVRLLKLNHNDWEETFYQHLARNFGFSLNALPFEMLSRSLPYKYLSKQRDQRLQVEALLFGQAGLLEKKHTDDYPKQLLPEYLFLKQKYSLQPIDAHLWKFMRLRPSGFPTLRIAQFADLICKEQSLFSKVMEVKKIQEARKFFRVSASDYWTDHFVFDKVSTRRKKPLSEASADLILINTVFPFLFVYGMVKNDPLYKERALAFFEKTEPENNVIIKKWKAAGMPAVSALQTQALLELKKNYCQPKKCLHCGIGNKLLQK